MNKPAALAPIVILTDFGYRDHYAGVMKGVIASIAPDAPVLDLTHGIPAQSVTAGALALRESWRYFPPRTIFLAIVDPGVGTKRLALAIETRAGARFVGPDNGLMWPAVEQAGLKCAAELRAERYRLKNPSTTFHGRDIFAPAAAHLWLGARISAMGPRVAAIQRLKLPRPRQARGELRGEIIHVDGFGNLISNIDRAALERLRASFPSCVLSIRIEDGAVLRLVTTYGEAPKGAPLATFGSLGLLEIAVRDGSAATRFAAAPGAAVIAIAVSRGSHGRATRA